MSAALLDIVQHLCYKRCTMPTKNPRLSVVLTPSLHVLLAQLSVETGDSASSLVRDLLIQSEVPLQRMLQLVRAAKDAKGQIGGGLQQSMDRVMRDLEHANRGIDHRAGDLLADLVAQAEVVRPRRTSASRALSRTVAAGSAGGSTPVLVTRGSGHPKRSESAKKLGKTRGRL